MSQRTVVSEKLRMTRDGRPLHKGTLISHALEEVDH